MSLLNEPEQCFNVYDPSDARKPVDDPLRSLPSFKTFREEPITKAEHELILREARVSKEPVEDLAPSIVVVCSMKRAQTHVADGATRN
jgi:hypothetical protein